MIFWWVLPALWLMMPPGANMPDHIGYMLNMCLCVFIVNHAIGKWLME